VRFPSQSEIDAARGIGFAVRRKADPVEQQGEAPVVEDRTATRVWQLDLARAGKVYSPKQRPTKHRRQRIAHFVGREGSVERFAIRQTLPFRGYDAFCPPSQAQYGAVSAFFEECCETRFQAHTMLCARDYARAIAADFSFTEARREFIWVCAAALILADPALRSLAVAWNVAHQGRSPRLAGGAHKRGYNRVAKFAAGLVKDMRAAGSEIFG
jgi:hypothetical protein